MIWTCASYGSIRSSTAQAESRHDLRPDRVPWSPTAAAAGRGIGAFNVITLEHAEAIVAGRRAGRAARDPSGEPERGALPRWRARTDQRRQPRAWPSRPRSTWRCTSTTSRTSTSSAQAVEHGYGSVMVDASAPGLCEPTWRVTAALATELHAQGLWVEAELGEVGGKDGAHAPGVRTDPDRGGRASCSDRRRRTRRGRGVLARDDRADCAPRHST